MKVFYLAVMAALLCCTRPAIGQTQEGADAKLAAQEWESAAMDYRALLANEESNAQNWFSLGSALHQLEDYLGARDAYAHALDAGYQRVPQARFRLARVLMLLGLEQEALAHLEEIAKIGGPNGAFVSNTAEFEPLAEDPRFLAVVKALTPCTDDEFHHFDFWLGEWDVTAAGSAQPTASSQISSKHDGCVVLEQYRVGSAYTGMSINFYDSVKKIWHQTWMANNGAPVYLEGALNADGAMQLTDEALPISKLNNLVNRVTWTPADDGSVRQFWETSTDGGKTWAVSFDGRYTRKRSD